ncbi:Large T antigen [Lyfec polyomavirus MAF4]|nr:Large T antigen [Lyfec polyomavirus MAF4]
MDSVLSRQEKKELCGLLDMPLHCFGNVPMMKDRFKKACLKHHPDKGGDGAKMMRLNCLWSNFQQEMTKLRAEANYSTFQDEPPIYGTSYFRSWWAEQQYYGYPYERFSQSSSQTSSSSSARNPGHTRHADSTGGRGQAGGAKGGPRGHRHPTSSASSTSSTATGGCSYSNLFTEGRPSSAETAEDTSQDSGAGVSGSSAETGGLGSAFQDSDLYCNESLESSPEPPSSSFPEDASDAPDSSYASQEPPSPPQPPRGMPRKRGFDDGTSSSASSRSFNSTPPKAKKTAENHHPADFPSPLIDFLSHAVYSNKTVSAFAVFSTLEKVTLLYEKIDKFKIDFKSRHKYRDPNGTLAGVLFFLTLSRHRVSAIKNFCATFCTVSFLIVKGVNKCPEFYRACCNDPFLLLEQSREGVFSYEFDRAEVKEGVSWNMIAEFAERHKIDDALIIMAHYLDFAKPFPCDKCFGKGLKPHKDHEKEHKNAKLFKDAKSQKNICQQAADVVQAKLRLRLMECTREELLVDKFQKQLQRLKELDPIPMLEHMAGVAWYCCLFFEFEDKLIEILKLLTENCPKHRNCLFIGPINSGKTSFAAALLDLLEGKALNVNCPADKLPFELGCAIDRFAVVFEDVKGQTSLNKTLQPGQGINNLDNLREHLDGAVPVNLEKKHVNKKTQIFPPCIVTSNDYLYPPTLLARFALTLRFEPREHLRKSLEANHHFQKHRILQDGLTLFMALVWLVPVAKFHNTLREDVKTWKAIINAEVGNEKFCKMIENIESGIDPLKDMVIEEEDESDQDSGRFTQSQ